MKTLPCKQCLKYPICKFRRTIFCTDLLKAFEAIEKESNINPWRIVEQMLPNLTDIDLTE